MLGLGLRFRVRVRVRVRVWVSFRVCVRVRVGVCVRRLKLKSLKLTYFNQENSKRVPYCFFFVFFCHYLPVLGVDKIARLLLFLDVVGLF